ncbi:MAG: hypothetical protein AB7P03_22670 [Kofleriaceae bacterium]
MRNIVAAATVLVGLCGLTLPAGAEPFVTGSIDLGEGFGDDAIGRAGSSIHVLAPVDGRWLLGGELAGSLEPYWAGFSCDPMETSMTDAEADNQDVCLRSSIGLHGLAGVQAAPSRNTVIRFEAGLGATTVLGGNERSYLPSGLLRVALLGALVPTQTSVWRIGIALDDRVLGIRDPYQVRSLGILFEATSR